MKVTFSPVAWAQFLHWCNADIDMVHRIITLIEDARRHPFTGLGKPEPLKARLRGFWSRRITGEHRLVYCVRGAGDAQEIAIAQCRYHYN